ncbi:hypothetical protein ACFQE1_14085 [Halobium palmae]|uniref:Uncharacterized protein n=1 Tax=Halobium palmae TaxID=1776492 RepID=A0ABD5S1S0_9EURY
MSANAGSNTGGAFVCPFCHEEESTHNRPLHLRTCRKVEKDVQVERVQRNTIDAEYDRAMGRVR